MLTASALTCQEVQLKQFVTTGPDGVEPGISTTEFWVAVVTWLLAVSDAFALHHFTQQQDALVIAGVPFLYMIVRALVKSAAQLKQGPKADPVALPVAKAA